MERYLKSPRKGSVLRVFHLVSSAEQVAQALSYLVSSVFKISQFFMVTPFVIIAIDCHQTQCCSEFIESSF